MERNKKPLIFSSIFNALYPLLGILFFFIGWYIPLYICAGIGTLWALLRMGNRDFRPILWIGGCVIGALLMYKGYKIGFWPLAALHICIYSFADFFISWIRSVKAARRYQETEDDLLDDVLSGKTNGQTITFMEFEKAYMTRHVDATYTDVVLAYQDLLIEQGIIQGKPTAEREDDKQT